MNGLFKSIVLQIQNNASTKLVVYILNHLIAVKNVDEHSKVEK